MIRSRELALELTERYGCPLYVLDEQAFKENYRHLCSAFTRYYPDYVPAYSFKTNYTPYIVSLVRSLGGLAEVVSGMEYEIALRTGYPQAHILFNGPNKGAAGIRAFRDGCRIHADHMAELNRLCCAAKEEPERRFAIGLRVNLDLGQSFVSRFGFDPQELPEAFAAVRRVENLEIVGLHCHISRCRSAEAWADRAKIMLALADRFFDTPPAYIDLGSGMFGDMAPEFAAQFEQVPSYEEYAAAVGGLFAEHYPEGKRPMLITEPGTTLINRYLELIGRVDAIKTVRGKPFAVLNCSEHNLGETCTLKQLPLCVLPMGGKQRHYTALDMTGYTCLEQDVMRKNYTGNLAVGDYVVFGNVGGYSTVLKPPFIEPNCAMTALREDGSSRLIKRAETYDDLLQTYIFEGDKA